MQNPYILWDNVLASTVGTLTATTYVAYGSVDNCVDGKPYTQWGGSGATSYDIVVDLGAATANWSAPDCIGFCAHNLSACNATVSVILSADGVNWSTAVGSTYAPSSTGVIFYKFTQSTVAYQYVGVRVACDAANSPLIGELMLGTALNFPKPPQIGTSPKTVSIEAVSNHSQSGILLGNSIRCHPVEMRYTWTYIPTTFLWDSTGGYQGYGEFWMQHGRYLSPFFMCLSEDIPMSKHFVRLTDKSGFDTPLNDSTMALSLSMSMISALDLG